MKKKLSILIYSLAAGGAERVVSILLDRLKDEFEITLFLMNSEIFYEVPQDIKIVYLENSNPNESGIKKLIKLPMLGLKYKKLNQASISLSFMNRPNYINIFAKIFGMKSKVLVSQRIAPSREYGAGSLKDKISKILLKRLYNRADIVLPNSKGIGYDLVENFDILEKKIRVIYNPIDIGKVAFGLKDEHGFKEDIFTFVAVGRLHTQKNHKLLLEAMSDIDAKLYIVGGGNLKEELERQIKTKNLEEKVILLGKQKNPYKFLKCANCFVFSSNYEGFPNVLLEALACELPIISTDCKSGPREILAPNSSFKKALKDDIEIVDFGILAPLNDKNKMQKAMKLIMKDSHLRENYTKKALKRARDFSVEKIIKQYKEVLCVD